MLKSIPRAEWLIIAAIMVLAAVLRFGWAGVNRFEIDQSRLSYSALKMARGGEFASLGMSSSVGVPFFPASVWLFSIPYFLTPDPLAATMFVGLLSLGTIFGVWYFARPIWGPWAGLTAALFLAASPYSVLYARMIWEPNVLPIFALAWACAAYYAITLPSTRARSVALAVTAFLVGVAFQLHFSGAALGLATGYLFLRFRWWRDLRPLLLGGMIASLGVIPYVLRVFITSPELAARLGQYLGSNSQTDFSVLPELLKLSLGSGWAYLNAGDYDQAVAAGAFPTVLVVVVLTLGLVALVKEIGQRSALPYVSTTMGTPRAPQAEGGNIAPLGEETEGDDLISPNCSRRLAELTLVWLVSSLLLFVRHNSPLYPHYLLVSLPAVALVAGCSVRLLSVRVWPSAVLGAMAVIATAWAVQLTTGLERAYQIETPNGISTPLSILRSAAWSFPDDAPLLLFMHGDDPYINGEASVFSVLLWDRQHRIINGEALLILPDHPAYLVASLAPFQAWEELEATNLARDVQTFERREGAPPYMMTRYDGETVPNGFTSINPAIRFRDGTQLEGWRVRRVGPRLRISTLWRVIDPPLAGTLQQFHHLHTADTLGDAPFRVFDVPLTANKWQVGDQVIVMGDFFPETFDSQPGQLWVEIGHYTLPDGVRVSHEGSENSDDRIRLGPFDWH